MIHIWELILDFPSSKFWTDPCYLYFVAENLAGEPGATATDRGHGAIPAPLATWLAWNERIWIRLVSLKS